MSTRPNILWICTDQQRHDTLGCNGNPFTTTPCADRLAAEGVHCTRAYCQNPVCTPSWASFLTGRYPRTTRCRGNGQAIPAEERLLPQVFHEAGYLCGLVGKLHLSPCHKTSCDGMERRIADGYTLFDWSHHPCRHAGGDQPGNAYQRWLRAQGFTLEHRPHPDCAHLLFGAPSELHQTTWCADRAIEQIDTARHFDRPFLVSFNCFDPHHDFDPPEAYLRPYLERLDEIPLPIGREHAPHTTWEAVDRRGAYGGGGMPGMQSDRAHRLLRAAYWAMCDHIDAQVARLIDHLERLGQLDNTIVIFTSDHGELLGDHGMYLKGPHLYDCAVRVPLILRGPGLPATRLDDLVELVDLAPTLYELAGIDAPAGLQGRSLLPRLRGEVERHREDAYCEFFNACHSHEGGSEAPRPAADSHDQTAPPSAPLELPPPSKEEANCTMIRSERYKLVRYHGPDRRLGLLFDLDDDPDELHNRIDDPACAAVRAELSERLADRIALTIDPLPAKHGPW